MDNLTAKQIDWLNRESLAAKEAGLGTVIDALISAVNDLITRVEALEAAE